MRVRRISLKEYKRFKELVLEIPPEPKLVLLTGANGCGKSSIFDAFNLQNKKHLRFCSQIEGDYHFRGQINQNTLTEQVNIEFYQKNTSLEIPFYIRSAYRFTPDCSINGITSQDGFGDKKAPARLIDLDERVRDNFANILNMSVKEVWSNKEKSNITIQKEIIGKVKDLMIKLFADLMLSDLGENPLTKGTFRFTKGTAKDFLYKNLSGGEKAVFDLLLDFVIKTKLSPESIFCIDEPELHVHTKLQAKLLEVMFELIPDSSQLWLATHSIGIIKQASTLWSENQKQIAFINFDGHNFDKPVTLRSQNPTKNFWEKNFHTTLGDLASLIIPETIIVCEGKQTKNGFDANVYNKIFYESRPDVQFISAGSCTEVKNAHLIMTLLLKQVKNLRVNIKYLIDRDNSHDNDLTEAKKEGNTILKRRSIENYLWDDEIITKLYKSKSQGPLCAEICNYKKELLSKKAPPDDIKSITSSLYVRIIKELDLRQCGDNTQSFALHTLVPLITTDTEVYKELEKDILS